MKLPVKFSFLLLFGCLNFFAIKSLQAQVPTITSFTPLTGVVGASVTITGTNFNTTTTNNVVFFGATRAAVSAATSTSLTVTVPAGATHAPITILNTGTTLTTASSLYFTPTFSPTLPDVKPEFFVASGDFSIGNGTNPSYITVGDLDGDGKPDMAVANRNNASLSIFRNTGSNGAVNFASKVDLSTQTTPQSVAIGDFNGDGKQDLAVTNYDAAKVSIFLNASTIGNISFVAQVDVTTGSNPVSVAIGDIDGDGKPDMAVANEFSDNVSVFRNTSTSGTISFSTSTNFATGSRPLMVVIGDLVGDGKGDMAVTNGWASGVISVFRNLSSSGSISFSASVNFTTEQFPSYMCIGDINGDGKLDLAITYQLSGSTLSVFRNTGSIGSIGFASLVNYITNLGSKMVSISDFNGDAKPDLATVDNTFATVSLFSNTGTIGGSTISISNNTNLTVGSYTNPIALAIADFDGDGKPDLAVTNNSNSVSVFRHRYNVWTGALDTNWHTAGNWSSGAVPNSSDYVLISSSPSNQPIIGATAVCSGMEISSSASLTVTGSNTLSIGTTLTNAGSISANASTISIGGTFTNTGTFNAGTGTVNYNGAAITGLAQICAVLTYNNLTLSGNHAKNFATTPTVNGILSLEGTAAVKVVVGTGVVTYGANATLQYNKTAAFTATSEEWIPQFIASGGIVVKNTGTITLNEAKVINKLSIESGAKVNLSTFSSWSNSLTLGGSNQADGIYGGTSSVLATTINSTYFATATGNLQKAANNTNLASLLISVGTLSPVFIPTTTSYSCEVGILDATITVTPAVFDNTSIIEVRCNGGSYATVSSGSASSALNLNVGSNTIEIRVTATDLTTKITTISILRKLPPVITSFTPLTGVVGATVTITGTGFSTTASNNVVFFGATRATVSAATATSLTVSVPSGATYAPITVLNNDVSLATYSSSSFMPIFSPAISGISSSNFEARSDLTTGSSPNSIAVGDIDGDGKPDLVATNNGSSTVSVFRNTGASGTISFEPKVDFATGSAPTSVAIADVNGDGKPDLVVANKSSATVSVFRNTSSSGVINTGSFATKVDFTTGSSPNSVAVSDIDGDGKPDLVVANQSNNSVSVLQNTSSSAGLSFADKLDFTTGSSPYSVAIGDINGDGKPDLAVANNGSESASVLQNTSGGAGISFASKVDFATGTSTRQPVSVVIGDLDGDGKPDLVVNNLWTGTASIFRNTFSSGDISTGSFATKVDYSIGQGVLVGISTAIGDINGDGKPDLVFTDRYTDNISVLRNNCTSGNINFVTKAEITTGTNPNFAVIGDLDGDGKPDIAFVDYNTSFNKLSIIRNSNVLWTGTLSTNWHTAGNWSSGIVPSASDYVLISSSASNQPIIGATAVCGILDIAPGATITISGSNTLTTSTDLFNSGTITANASTINIGANFTNSGTFAAGTGTVNYNAAGAQTAASITYNNLTLSNSGRKTITGVTVNGVLSMEGTATANVAPTYGSNATLQYNTATARTPGIVWVNPFLATGGVVIKNTGIITLDGSIIMGNNTNVPLNINSGATLSTNSSFNFGVTLHGDFINNGTFSAEGSSITISGTTVSQNIAGFNTNYGEVSMTKTAGTATFTGNVSGVGLTINGSGGTLNLGTGLTHSFTSTCTLTSGTLNSGSSTLSLSAASPFGGTIGNFTVGTGTVNYSGAAQTVAGITYYNLTLSGSGVKTTSGVTVNGVLSMEGTATASAAPTYGSSATLQYNTSTGRTAGVEWVSPFTGLAGVVINNTGAITLNAAKVMNKLSIASGASLNLSTFTTSRAGILLLNNATQLKGSYGGTGATATYINTTYFGAAAGVLTVSSSWTGATNTDWGTTTNWSDGAVPISTDNVYIPSSAVNQPVIGSAAVCRVMEIASGASLTISGSNTLTLTDLSNAGTITANGSTISIGGVFTNTGTFTAGTGTVNYNGAAQTALVLAYNNLTVSGTGTKTFATTPTVNGILSMEGTTASITVTTGVVTYGANATLQYNKTAAFTATTEEWISPFVATGGIIIKGTGAITTPGPVVIGVSSGTSQTAALDINSGATLTPGANLITFFGNFINAGTLTSGSGGITITGETLNQNIAGFTTTGNVSMTKFNYTATFTGNVNGAGLTINGALGSLNLGTGLTHTFSGNWANTAGTLQGGTSTLNIAGAANTSGATFNAGSGTVNYNGAAQTALVYTYNNLTVSGTLAKTFATTPTVNGILSMEGTTASITVTTGVVTYGANATLQYNKTAAFTATTEEWISPFVATGGIIIKGTLAITTPGAVQIGNNTGVPLNINASAILTPGASLITLHGDFINAGTLTSGSGGITIAGTTTTQSIAGFTTTGNVSMTKTAGTATFTGNVNGAGLTINGLGGTLNLGTSLTHTFSGVWANTAGTLNGGTSTLNIAGAANTSGGTFTAGTGTVNYNGVAQTALVYTYNNLTLSGSLAKTFATSPTINGVLSMEGTATMTITTGTITYGASATLQYNTTTSRTVTLTEWPNTWSNASGGVIIRNTGVITLNAVKTSVPKLTITTSSKLNPGGFVSTGWGVLVLGTVGQTATGTWGFTGSGATNINATFFAGTGTIAFGSSIWTWTGTTSTDWNNASNWNTNAVPISTNYVIIPSGPTNQPIIGSAAVCGILDIASGASLTISGSNTLTISTNVINSGTITANASTLSIAGNFTNTGIFTAGTSTVNYSGSAQTVAGITYNNLTLSGSGVKTTTNVTVNGVLSMEGAATASAIITYGPSATLQYNTATGRTSASTEWVSPFTGSGGVIINNTGAITLNAAKVINKLSIASGASINLGTFTTSRTGILLLNNATQSKGSYGGTGSGATNINPSFFGAAAGVLTVYTSWTGATNTDWFTSTNWSDGAVPIATDYVIIPSSAVNQPTIGSTAVCGILEIASGASLTISGSNTLTLTDLSNAGTITANASTISIGGVFTNTGTFTAGSGTVNYNGAAQTVTVVTYNNLTLSGSGTKTLQAGTTSIAGNLTLGGTASTTTVVNITIGGNLLVGDGTNVATFTAAAFTLGVTGTTTVANASTLAISSATGTKTFTGAVTINSGGTLSESAAAPLAFGNDVTINGTLTENGAAVVGIAGNLTNNGTYTASTGVHTFSGASKTIGGTTTNTIPRATFTGTYTNSGTLTSATLLTITGVTLTNTGTINSTTSLTGTGTLSNTSGTVNITGGSCSITTNTNAGTFAISGTATSVTAIGSFTNTGTINISGSGAINGITNNAAGVVNHSGASAITSFNNATSTSTLNISSATVPTITTLTATAVGNTVNYTGAAQTNCKVTTYHNLTLSGTLAKTFATPPTINGVLSMEGSATMTITNAAALIYGASATLKYNTSTGRTAGVEWVSPFTGSGGVVIMNTGAITLNAAKVITQLSIASGAVVNLGTFTTSRTGILLLNNATQPKGTHGGSGSGATYTNTTYFGAAAGVLTVYTSWTGATNTDWATSTNWSDGTVPIATDKVFIPSIPANQPNIGSTVVCGILEIASGATLTISGSNALTLTDLRNAGTITANASTISVGGVFTNTGTFTAGTSTVNYTGTAQTCVVTSYYNLTLSGSGAKTFATTPTVNNILSLEGTASVIVTVGVVTYGTNATLQYNKSASYTITTAEWPNAWANASGGVIIKNTGVITLNAAKTAVPKLTISTGSVLNPGGFNSTGWGLLTLGTAGQSATGTWGAIGATNNNTTFFTGTGTIAFGSAFWTWIGTTSTAWNTASNWSPASVPTSTSEVIIPNVTNQPTITTTAGAAKNITIRSGVTLTNTAGLTLTTGNLLLEGGLQVLLPLLEQVH